MKTTAIIALSIVGVLGTAGAAMAVNAATLSPSQSTIGQATDLLVPGLDPTNSPSLPSTDDDNGLRGDGTVDDDAPGSTPSPSPSYSDDDDDDDSYDDSDDSDDSDDDDYEDSDEDDELDSEDD